MPTVNWTEYFTKMGAQYLQQRIDSAAAYNWLPMTPVNPQLFGTVAPPQAAFAIQQLGTLNSVVPPIGVPQPSNGVPCVQSSAQLPNATR